jgi:hypothetical protein
MQAGKYRFADAYDVDAQLAERGVDHVVHSGRRVLTSSEPLLEELEGERGQFAEPAIMAGELTWYDDS